ncbi:MAG: RidA family protein [Planctomycetes bacterium]|nr:RidA family protein [Planctomycetota bacterium]
MVDKTPYYNDELPTLRFPWALKVSDFSELLLVSGHADVKLDNSTVNFPGDLIGQTKFILNQIAKNVEAAGFTLDNAIRTEITLSKEVTDEQLPELFRVLTEYVGDVDVKPAAGTLRLVVRLILRDCLVEIELLLAR